MVIRSKGAPDLAWKRVCVLHGKEWTEGWVKMMCVAEEGSGSGEVWVGPDESFGRLEVRIARRSSKRGSGVGWDMVMVIWSRTPGCVEVIYYQLSRRGKVSQGD